MLIGRAELEDGTVQDVRVNAGRISAIGTLTPHPGEEVIDANGGLLLPGLHDHHIHVAALAASLNSVACGPPDVTDANALTARLQTPGSGWLRGTGYHESVAGLLDRDTLDQMAPHRPVRIQHRTGRMWFFNSLGLDLILKRHPAPPGLERDSERLTGRLFDEDAWLRRVLSGTLPSFADVGSMLAQVGVTGLTDLSPANDAVIARHFAAEQERGALPQRVMLAGKPELTTADMHGALEQLSSRMAHPAVKKVRPTRYLERRPAASWSQTALKLGAAKLHLHDANLPALEDAVSFIAQAHARGRAVAVHCVTDVELMFALAAFDEAGAEPGDRIEHASVAPDHLVESIARLGLAVVSQPHFIAERGDIYRREVEPEFQPVLYRLRAFLEAGVPLAGGSDAPYGGTDPWAAMAAAVSRRTKSGHIIAGQEALTPEEALDLYLRDPENLRRRRRIEPGSDADLCLLNQPWAIVRHDLSARHVRATFIGGQMWAARQNA